MVSLPNLIYLDLYDNQIRDIENLHTIPTLRVVMLSKNKIAKIKNLEFLTKLDPALADLRDRLYDKANASDKSAGTVNAAWAAELGLAEGTQLAVGAFDAHMGAVGASIKDGSLIKIMGTSTCDLLISEKDQTN